MEKELNIAAILKEKPEGIKLYDKLRNIDVHLDDVVSSIEETTIWCNGKKDNNDYGSLFSYSKFGTERGWLDGLQILKPSKEMLDWEKFAWKKGDVLRFSDILVIFEKWSKDDYTEFKAAYEFNCHSKSFGKGNDYYTAEFCKVIDETANNFVKKIEEHYGGKLNLSTLEIEKPGFKEGDIVFVKGDSKVSNSIGIVKGAGNGLNYHYWANYFYRTDTIRVAESSDDYVLGHSSDEEVRMANKQEKQKLFDALAKEGKVWNPDTLQVEDLPKKCEFKAMDYVLVKDNDEDTVWQLYQYAFERIHQDGNRNYHMIGGRCFRVDLYKFLPYNNQTAHLLGTTDEWKGGEG